jgi:hypothetical protein
MDVQLHNQTTDSVHQKKTLIDNTQENLEDLKKLIAINVKITKLLLEGRITADEYDKIYGNYESRFKSAVQLREILLKHFQSEIKTHGTRLASVYDDKEILSARQQIGDIQQNEYVIKMRAIDWEIQHLEEKINRLKDCLNISHKLKDQLELGDLNYIHNFISQDFNSIKRAKLNDDVKSRLNTRIETMLELVHS